MILSHYSSLWTVLWIFCATIAREHDHHDRMDEFLAMFQSKPHGIYRNYTGPLLSANEEGTLTFNCLKLFEERALTPVTWPPPETMPDHLRQYYTMGEQIPTRTRYLKEAQNGGRGYNWTARMIEIFMKRPNTCGQYRNEVCHTIIKRFAKNYIVGKRGAVVGSQSPWAEAALLSAGAVHLTTIEYMNITSHHSQLHALRPEEVAAAFLGRHWEPLDFIFCYSSIEHDGLGRYGDPLNPFADLEAVAKMNCLLKPGGVLFLGFPFGPDEVVWNSHRIYGKTRLLPMLSFWRFVSFDGKMHDSSGRNAQPIFVLQREEQLEKQHTALYFPRHAADTSSNSSSNMNDE